MELSRYWQLHFVFLGEDYAVQIRYCRGITNIQLAMPFDHKDLLNILSKVSSRRLLNGLKVISGFYLSRILRKPIHWGNPVSLSIEPTTHCNLRCPQCPSGLRSFTRPTGIIDKHLFQEMIDELQDSVLYLMMYFQGEPYLHPHFHDLVRYAADKNIYTATSTNGHYLSRENAESTVKSGLDRLIISLDGASQDTYQKYRIGGRLQQVLSGVDQLIQAKKRLKSRTPYIQLQFIVFGFNEHELHAFRDLCAQRKLKPMIKSAQIYDDKPDKAFLPSNGRHARYRRDDDGNHQIKGRQMNHCWKMWHSSVITWDGRVVPCCFDKDAAHSFGQINGTGFAPIWKNRSYNQFRNRILKDRKGIDICTNCTEGTRVWL
jgi:radical SAM protein with 4Fe4S-binding SPASM domain